MVHLNCLYCLPNIEGEDIQKLDNVLAKLLGRSWDIFLQRSTQLYYAIYYTGWISGTFTETSSGCVRLQSEFLFSEVPGGRGCSQPSSGSLMVSSMFVPASGCLQVVTSRPQPLTGWLGEIHLNHVNQTDGLGEVWWLTVPRAWMSSWFYKAL